MNLDQLKRDLIRDESERLLPYRCSAGKLTIGIGHNIQEKGISKAVSDLMYEEDKQEVFDDLDRNIPWWRSLDEVRQRVLANMCFNLGWPVLSQFKQTLAHVKAGNYEEAAKAMEDSLWHSQVGPRALRLEHMMRTGRDP